MYEEVGDRIRPNAHDVHLSLESNAPLQYFASEVFVEVDSLPKSVRKMLNLKEDKESTSMMKKSVSVIAESTENRKRAEAIALSEFQAKVDQRAAQYLKKKRMTEAKRKREADQKRKQQLQRLQMIKKHAHSRAHARKKSSKNSPTKTSNRKGKNNSGIFSKDNMTSPYRKNKTNETRLRRQYTSYKSQKKSPIKQTQDDQSLQIVGSSPSPGTKNQSSITRTSSTPSNWHRSPVPELRQKMIDNIRNTRSVMMQMTAELSIDSTSSSTGTNDLTVLGNASQTAAAGVKEQQSGKPSSGKKKRRNQRVTSDKHPKNSFMVAKLRAQAKWNDRQRAMAKDRMNAQKYVAR
eukprot:g697.t1